MGRGEGVRGGAPEGDEQLGTTLCAIAPMGIIAGVCICVDAHAPNFVLTRPCLFHVTINDPSHTLSLRTMHPTCLHIARRKSRRNSSDSTCPLVPLLNCAPFFAIRRRAYLTVPLQAVGLTDS